MWTFEEVKEQYKCVFTYNYKVSETQTVQYNSVSCIKKAVPVPAEEIGGETGNNT